MKSGSKPGTMAAIIGSGIGSALTTGVIVLLVFFGALNCFRRIDELSFAFAVVEVVVTALTILGSFTLVNTWNDIDDRSRRMVEGYRSDALEEIERNASERQQAINQVGKQWEEEILPTFAKFKRTNLIFTLRTLTLLTLFVGASLWRKRRLRRQILMNDLEGNASRTTTSD